MKKSLLLGAAVLAFGFAANAQKVQNIPNAEYLQLSQADGWSEVDINVLPDDGSDPKPRTVQNSKVKDDNGNIEGFWQFDSMQHGDVARLKLNNTEESCYVINFIAATKENGVTLHFEIFGADGESEWFSNYEVYNNGDWNGRFEPTAIYVEEPLSVGEKTLEITFLRDDEATKNTVNIAKFKFEAREEIETFSVDTYVEPSDAAGRIVLSPYANRYLAGTEVTATVTTNTGYRFKNWELNGDVAGETTTMTFTVDSRSEVVAYFDELKMDNDVPGYINLYTRNGGLSKDGAIQTSEKGIKLDGESVEGGENEAYLGNYRNGQAEEFDLNVTEAGAYTFYLAYGLKEDKDVNTPALHFAVYDKAAYKEDPANAVAEWDYTTEYGKDIHVTGQWNNFESVRFDGVNLTEGAKVLHIDFIEPVASRYTINVYKMGFGLGDNWGDEGDQNGVADITLGENAPVKAYNLQGIEVEPTTKGLLILSNGTKVLNK